MFLFQVVWCFFRKQVLQVSVKVHQLLHYYNDLLK